MKNIYVSNLSPNVGNEDLKEIFAEYGAVTSANVILDRYTGKSRGFAFVEMTNDDEADKAINELNGATLDNNTITVNIAKPKTEKKNFRQGNNHNRSRRY